MESKRTVGTTIDPSAIENLQYNNSAGSKKVSEVGRHLLPLKFVSGGVVTYSTDASSAARVLDCMGKCLAVYNNSGSVQSLTLGEDSSVVALAAGAVDANGHVGIPCMPNAWTYIACSQSTWLKTTSATLLVFVIDDNSSIKTS